MTAHRVTTHDDRRISYDALLLALGARPEEAVPGAFTFRGPEDSARLRAALARLHAGEPLRVAFVAGADTAWTLPLYELALLTARWADDHGLAIEPWLVTWEHKPLTIFGEQAAGAIAELLADAGVRLWTGAFADCVDDGRLWISLEGRAAGRPRGRAAAPRRPARRRPARTTSTASWQSTTSGASCDVPDVYAAGDMTSRPLKQGGLATQQADAAAATIAAAAGAPVAATAYRPVLRAMLLTGGRPRYLRRSAGEPGSAAEDAPWWPPHKIAGRELAPYLTAHPELVVT